ncbi:MAG: hypothetical protein AB7P52_03440 [Alphaproteobacteria bacterium]
MHFYGEAAGKNAYQWPVNPFWTLQLVPAEHGWDLGLIARDGIDLSQVTPPFRLAPNPRQLYGWHFRNQDNTGPNDGSVNAPQALRLFVFSPALEGTGGFKPSADTLDQDVVSQAEGRGWLKVLDYGLADLAPGQQARMVYLAFEACLSWPKAVTEALAQALISPELVERFGACGLPPDYALTAYLTPVELGGDFDGDGTLDLAAPVTRRADGKRALALCRAGTYLDVIGLEGEMGHLMPAYFDRMDWWGLYPKGEVHQGVAEGAPPALTGDAILLGMEEKSSVLLYWDGGRYAAYWQGD